MHLSVSRAPRLRLLVAGSVAGGLLALPVGVMTAPALLASPAASAAAAAAVAATGSPDPEPTPQATTAPPILPPRPTATTEPSQTQEPTETVEPTATATATRTRTRTSTPRPRRTSEAPVVRETPDEPLPVVTGGFDVGAASPGLLDGSREVSAEPTTAPVAARNDKPTDTVTRLIQLVVSAGVLLGIGGVVGLYLTRS